MIYEYEVLHTIKGLILHIEATGGGISNREQVLYVLGGLGNDYASIITTITQKKHVPLWMKCSVH